jgi:hypothetical protein
MQGTTNQIIPLYFCLWAWKKSKVGKRQVDTRNESLGAFWMLLPA